MACFCRLENGDELTCLLSGLRAFINDTRISDLIYPRMDEEVAKVDEELKEMKELLKQWEESSGVKVNS